MHFRKPALISLYMGPEFALTYSEAVQKLFQDLDGLRVNREAHVFLPTLSPS